MNSLILTVRALTAEFVKRLALPLILIGFSMLVVLLGLSIWLTTMNGWWGILLGVVILVILIFTTLVIIASLIITAVTPSQNKSQKKAVKEFVDKLQDIAETVQTPKVVIVGQLVWDVIQKKNDGLLRRMSGHTLTTKRDFEAIRDSFDTKR